MTFDAWLEQWRDIGEFYSYDCECRERSRRALAKIAAMTPEQIAKRDADFAAMLRRHARRRYL